MLFDIYRDRSRADEEHKSCEIWLFRILSVKSEQFDSQNKLFFVMSTEEIDPEILAMLAEGDDVKADPMEVEKSDSDSESDSDDSDDDSESEEEESADNVSEEESEDEIPPPAKKAKVQAPSKPPPPTTSPEDWIGKQGTRSRLLDNGDHLYINGEIQRYIPPVEADDDPFWWFEHEDGDGEELELHEVKDCISLYKSRPKTKSTREKLMEQVALMGNEYSSKFNQIMWGKSSAKGKYPQ